MSALPMYKRCSGCGISYSYNPSVGDMGLICPHCKRPSGIGEVSLGPDLVALIMRLLRK